MGQDSHRSEDATGLIEQILETHHRYQRDLVPQAAELVRQIHESGSSDAANLVDVWRGFRADLEHHMMKEGQILFPAIREFASAEQEARPPRFLGPGLESGFQQMRREHRSLQEVLQELISESRRHGASSLTELLAALHADLAEHIGTEEEDLWNQARALEGRVTSGVAS